MLEKPELASLIRRETLADELQRAPLTTFPGGCFSAQETIDGDAVSFALLPA